MCAQHLKKSLGQHFLRDEEVLQRISDAIGDLNQFKGVVEIGPGAGALTRYLLSSKPNNFYAVELDDKWAAHLEQTFPLLRGRLIHQDFLQADLGFIESPIHVVGNFPYNISSQIVFWVIEQRERVQQLTGMFQKEVAMRIASKKGTKDYGILSVLTQAYYDCEYLFDVKPEAFTPPPKVMSGVVQIKRRLDSLKCDEQLFKTVVKTAFGQRRKTMRNSLKQILMGRKIQDDNVLNLRPEQLSVSDFEKLTNDIANSV
jgi:16S rRNA (adenine1518-N6/adenine1519-N6)-dimethyltransferase